MAKRLVVRRDADGWTAKRGLRPVARAGVTECWPGRAYAWFEDLGLTKREWAEATKLVQAGLDEARKRYNRIEIAVYGNHEAAHRWAKRLGFELEHRPSRYMPDGSDGCLYVMFGD